jgi:hypothetical protein
LKLVNLNSVSESAAIHVSGFNPTNPVAVVNVLSASLGAANTAQTPMAVTPTASSWQHNLANGVANYTCPPYSVTTIAFQGNAVFAPPATILHRYSFAGPANATTFADLVGNATGTVVGTAHLDGNGHLVFTGGTSPNNTNYATLPAHLLDTNLAFTIEAWVSFGNNPTWARFIGFGDTSGGNGVNYTDFIPNDGFHGDTRWETGSFAIDQSGSSLNNTTNLHLVLVYNNNPAAHYMAVYTNGLLMGANYSISPYTFNMTHCWIGKSSYSADPNGVFTLDELRIYDGAMPSWQLAENDSAGPDKLPDNTPTLSIAHSGNNINLSWPATAAGYSVQTATALGTGVTWAALPGAPAPIFTNNALQITLPITNQSRFYRLVE